MRNLTVNVLSLHKFLGTISVTALLQIVTLLNMVREFGNKRPLICGAGGQRCPSLLSACLLSNRCLFCCSAV